MEQFSTDISEFLEHEENALEMKLKQISENKAILVFEPSLEFALEVKEVKGKSKALFTISSKESLLQGQFVQEVGDYCQQGEKSVFDVLVKCTDVFAKVLEDGEAEDEDNESDDGVETSAVLDLDDEEEQIPIKSTGTSSSSDVISGYDPEMDKIQSQFNKFLGNSSMQTAVNRLIKDYYSISKSNPKQFGYNAEPKNDNLFLWEVRLFGFDIKDKGDEGKLALDLDQYMRKPENKGQDYVELEMKFPNEYPYKPPFIRVIKPRFVFHTGHVTIGGSICMELLTSSGWSPSNSIEAILIQIRTQMIAGKGRIDFAKPQPYTEAEAKDAFFRVAMQHGWEKSRT